jgi:hypothetical protein
MVTINKHTSLFAVVAVVIGSLTAVSCSKENDELEVGRDGSIESEAYTKTSHRFLAFTNGTAPFEFSVKKDNCPWGIANNDNTNMHIRFTGQNATQYNTQQYCNVSSSRCIFEKGPNAFTGGPVYEITPNQGANAGTRVKLVVRVKGVTVPESQGYGCGQWFAYDPTTNTWSACPAASNFFIWSTQVGETRCRN